jgi:hypothetical protein
MEIHRSRTAALFSPAPNSGLTTASAASPVIPTGPVTAIPVPGGPPVQVIPTGPVSGGVITGTPTTGGAPVTAIPTGPVTGIPVANASPPMTAGPVSGGAAWVHFLRVQTASHVYDLACTSKSCSLNDRQIQLGDLLAIRLKKKVAYLSWLTPGKSSEGKFQVLDVRNIGQVPAPPPH